MMWFLGSSLPGLFNLNFKKNLFRKRLWSKVEALGGAGELVGILKAMYRDDTLAIDVNGSIGGLINLGRGVKQGCILSPLLFNIFIANLGDSLSRCQGIPLGSTKISGINIEFCMWICTFFWQATELKDINLQDYFLLTIYSSWEEQMRRSMKN